MELTALLIGIAGSLHCFGMCSPLAMAVTGMKPSAVLNRALYNFGRIGTYGVMGALVAGVGAMLPLHPVQDLLSVVLGIALLVVALGRFHTLTVPGLTPALRYLANKLKGWFGHYLQQKNRRAIIIMGALNGLLPCGLTVIALSWCLTLKGPLDGFTFMVLFGGGTLPVMLGLTSVLPSLLLKLKWNIRGMTTAMLVFSGAALIVRAFIVHLPHVTTGNQGVVDIILCR